MIRPCYRRTIEHDERVAAQILAACEDAIKRRLRPSVAFLHAACPGATSWQVQRIRNQLVATGRITLAGLGHRNRLVGGWGGLDPVHERAQIVANYRAVRREKIARGEQAGLGPYPGVLGLVLEPGVA